MCVRERASERECVAVYSYAKTVPWSSGAITRYYALTATFSRRLGGVERDCANTGECRKGREDAVSLRGVKSHVVRVCL